MKSDTIEHLKLIQNIITRMAGNSGQMKRWTMALVPVVAAFGKFGDAPLVAGFSGGIPLLFMWWQDAKYLKLEKAYRKMYEAIVAGESVKPFDLNPDPYLKLVDSVVLTAFSWSVAMFYPVLLGALVFALWLL